MMQSFGSWRSSSVAVGARRLQPLLGEGSPIIGGFSHVLLRGVGVEPNADYGATIPQQTSWSTS